MTHSAGYRKMKTPRSNKVVFDSWIVDEDLPPSPTLKVVRKTKPDYGFTEDEIRDRHEFIRCYLMQEHELLAAIPSQDSENDFFIVDCCVTDDDYSAFNTMDYHRQMRPFNKYAYAIKMKMERVKDLAIMHSSISSEEGRRDIHRRFQAFVNSEFRDELLSLVKRFRWTHDEEKRQWMKSRIGELNRRIIDCKKIWERFAPPENWDR